jgi:hypothetical protein
MARKNCFQVAITMCCVLATMKISTAEPLISTVSGTVAHGNNITISGSGFGMKPTASPFIWDDASGNDPLDKWDVVYPFTNDAPFRLAYRTPSQVTRAGGAVGGVALPHQHIQRYICGAHYNSSDPNAYSGLDVGAVKNNQQGNIYSYISYYRTIDPHWHLNTDCPEGEEWLCDHNFKEYDYAEGYGIYGDMNNIYLGNGSGSDPFKEVVWGGNYIEGMELTIYSVNTDFMNWYQEYGTVFSNAGVPGVGQGWQKVELILKHKSADGFHKVYQDNRPVWDISLDDDGLTPGPRVETVFGGFSRESGSTDEYKNNWRYYADVYYDHSLARVMLANNQDYDQATIIEPQIPSAWADGSITARANFGKLPDSGIAYLFVFDAANQRNQTGYPVSLSSPLADFSAEPASGAAPLTVSFTDNSLNNPTAWSWDFGDGSISIQKNPEHTYESVGYFSVSLTATGPGGAATMTKSDYINVAACSNGDVRIEGAAGYYQSIQDAYDHCPDGDTIQLHAVTLSSGQDLDFAKRTAVTIQGGFGCDYSSDPGFTAIINGMTIKEGSITLNRIVLQ